MADDTPFLSRWSQRKALVRQGRPAPEPPREPTVQRPVSTTAQPGTAPASPASPVSSAVQASAGPAAGAPGQDLAGTSPAASMASKAPAAPNASDSVPPPPTLADVAALPVDAADYSRFVARSVSPEVKNAALKKLFTDPHFNVMDGLDIYIDDYSKPDPLPASMLRQMVQSRALGLFDDEDDPPEAHPAAAGPAPQADASLDADTPPEASVSTAASPPPSAAPDLDTLPHEDADLRLQPHPAAGPDGLAAGAEPPPGRQH